MLLSDIAGKKKTQEEKRKKVHSGISGDKGLFSDLEVKYPGIIFSETLSLRHHTSQDPLIKSQRGYCSQ